MKASRTTCRSRPSQRRPLDAEEALEETRAALTGFLAPYPRERPRFGNDGVRSCALPLARWGDRVAQL